MKIFVAAGHGGKDPGAVYNQTTEREELVKIIDQAVQTLQKITDTQHEIIQVPNAFNLQAEVDYINQQSTESPSDFCIEVHMNSNPGIPGTGIETYYGEAEKAAKLHTEIVKQLGLKDRGVKYGMMFYFNNASYPPSALVEMGFLNNPDDLRIVREKGAAALARAIAIVWGLPDPAAQPPAPEKQPSKNRIVQILQKIIDFIRGIQQAEAATPAAWKTYSFAAFLDS